MRYYGFYGGYHDSGVAILDESGNLEFYAHAERYGKRVKTENSLAEILDFIPPPSKEDIVCVPPMGLNYETIEGQHPVVAMKSTFSEWMKKNIRYEPNYCISHHLCHILSSWFFRKNDETRFALAFDGAGPNADGMVLGSCFCGMINEDGFSLKVCDPPIPSSCSLGSMLGFNSAGKAMGLSGFLEDTKEKISEDDIVRLVESFTKPYMPPPAWLWTPGQQEYIPSFPWFPNPSEEDLKFIAKFYKFWINRTWDSIKKNLENFIPNKELGIVVGGGTCLALELNTNIASYVKDFVFGPAINDSGLVLGAASYGYFLDKGKWPKALKTPSIMYLQEPLSKIGPQEPKEIAKLIAQDKVVGLLRGKAECGPRALGFRSILANASKYENLKRVSQELKGREYYRPLAPMVTAESFDRYFTGPKGEYMQYRCECNLAAKMECPAIVHKDNSSRPQVVHKEKDPWLHELLVEYGRITGSECIINTSLNGPGKPICNTYSDALYDFKEKDDIELISIPQEN